MILINTARGKVIVEDDLAEAMKSGKVRAYGTDVFFSDPPDPKSPLLSAPNVVMTPHIGGSSKENLPAALAERSFLDRQRGPAGGS